ncbi:hypothetical protein RDWZM_006509 [Blomia tropicalis]|uniref:TEP1-F n=1 Tax=Blomia tropicalis TaxID=40697 RepID=A0A9Q0MAM0_BLOTA|nr:hypothetical protein RDWZM_006509 [Blomia tropicalis]
MKTTFIWTLWFCATILLISFDTIQTSPTYTIVAPSKIRPNSDYHVSIQLSNATKSSDFEVELSGPSNDGTFNRVSKSVQVNPVESRILNLEIGEWSKGNYKLIVKGHSDELDFSNETVIGYEPKSYSIFVQTDKAIYKPGQIVKFRAIIVNPNLIPTVPGSLDIYIKDSKDNLIKQWKRVFPIRGVVSEELQLSEQPPLGDWSIMVDVQGQKFTKKFSVAEYVLPTFSIDVILPPYATYNRSDVIATVKATYTYGKPVKGEVTLTVQPRIRHSSITFRPLEQFQTKMKIKDEGSVDIPVNIVRDLNLKTDFFEREIEFFALVEEGLTGRKYNKSAVMKIYHKEVKVELIKTSKHLNQVAYQDDKPVDDNGPPLSLKYGYSYNDVNWTNTLYAVPRKGMIRIDLYPPKSDPDNKVFIIGWRAEYRGQTYFLESVDCAQSPSDSFVQVIQQDDSSLFAPKPVKVGDEMKFQVNSTEPLINLVYKVMAKGDLVLARSIRSDSPSNTMELTIPITHRMAPKARLIVYYVRPSNQEIVADALSFQVDGVFKTPVHITSNTNQTKPGSMVDISVETKPSAYVGLLGVDQSVLLLRQGNDITQDDILQEMESYDIGKKNSPEFDGFYRPIFWSGSSTAGEIFDDSGVVVLTNGILFRESHSIYRLYNSIHIDDDDKIEDISLNSAESLAFVQTMSSDSTFSREGSPGTASSVERRPERSETIRIRKKFPETWIWANLTSGLCSICKRVFYAADGGGVIVFKKARPQARVLDSIRLDDTILEEGLQPPTNFKVSTQPESRIVLRQKFPETWIWTNMTTGFDGIAKYSDRIPDTITSWYISAFAVDSISGLSVAENGLKINVFRPFFVKLSLPYSIIRGESVSIQVLVFNYQSKPVSAEVTMENEKQEFEFSYAANEIEFAGETEIKSKSKTVTIPPFDGVSVSFVITPKRLGPIDIKVSAKADNAGDAVIRKLLVKPEGQIQYFNEAMFVKLDASSASVMKRNVSINIPNNAVPGSVRVTVNGISDILGPTVNNIDDLLRMPYGCGEQNMIVNRLNEGIKSKAIKHIETGYQRELTYRRDDGSFSAFGNSDRAGSTWLTAFVVKSFIQARPYIDVDPLVINKAIEWLLTRQKKDGSFAEYGEVHNKALQGGAALKIGSQSDPEVDTAGSLTAYVLIAILQLSRSDPIRVKNEFAIKKLKILSILVYRKPIIHMRLQSSHMHSILLIRNIKILVTRNYRRWQLKIPMDCLPNALEVEATAYALLTLSSRSDTKIGIPALRWLISKQNSNGGFASTQDTIIALQALGSIAQQISTSSLKMEVSIKNGPSKEDSSQSMQFIPENALVLQRIELEPESRWVELDAKGFGTAILQISYQYNVAVSAEKPAFFLNPQKDKTSTENYLQLSVCTYYKDGNSTNMAVMEVELPSGYNADVDALPAATRAKEVKRVDTTNNDGTVFVYFDRITRDELCITVPAHRTHRVANNKPVPVTIYDYYDRSKLSRIFYEPTLVTVNDIVDPTFSASSSTPSSSSLISSSLISSSDSIKT